MTSNKRLYGQHSQNIVSATPGSINKAFLSDLERNMAMILNKPYYAPGAVVDIKQRGINLGFVLRERDPTHNLSVLRPIREYAQKMRFTVVRAHVSGMFQGHVELISVKGIVFAYMKDVEITIVAE